MAAMAAVVLMPSGPRRVPAYTSTGTALAISKVTPYIWVAALTAWTVSYGSRQKKKNERPAAMTTAEVAETGPRETV